jgi:Protein of unknown function (DUF998)
MGPSGAVSRDPTDVGKGGPLTGRRKLMFQQLKAASEELLGGSVLQPSLKYRTAIGVLGVALPPVLLFWPAVDGVQNSISAYYYTGGRDWFVGNLWVVGVFLFFYQYKPRQDEAKSQLRHIRSGWADACLGKFAGVSAVAVALLPTTPPGVSNKPPIIGMSHGVAAFVLFLSLSLFPLLLFSQSKERFRVYKWSGRLMLFFLGLIIAYALAPDSVRLDFAPWRPVLVLECLLIWTFGFSWFAKGRTPAVNEAPTAHRTDPPAAV